VRAAVNSPLNIIIKHKKTFYQTCKAHNTYKTANIFFASVNLGFSYFRNICQKFKLALVSTSTSKIWWRSDDPRPNYCVFSIFLQAGCPSYRPTNSVRTAKRMRQWQSDTIPAVSGRRSQHQCQKHITLYHHHHPGHKQVTTISHLQ